MVFAREPVGGQLWPSKQSIPGLELYSRQISCFHAFWCFPGPILAICEKLQMFFYPDYNYYTLINHSVLYVVYCIYMLLSQD